VKNLKQQDSELVLFCKRLLPRILTQICRDPQSPCYGSFDRNWWHYKIRDFPSIILQQGGYTLYCAAQLPQFRDQAENLTNLAAATCHFWNKRAIRRGAFEEYYPWEQGYPPVAFSSLSVAKLAAAGVIETKMIFQGLEVAARQLQSRFESQATNQQVAGTAALCWIRKIVPSLVDEALFENICNKTLACQHEEGWYMEYGGPDLGYLSVTMDCLWDAYDATGDIRFLESAHRALDFIAPFVAMPHRGAGMHNARNTDYIVPYSSARSLEIKDVAQNARMVLFRVFENIGNEEHFLHAIDDRYYCHYIGHSLFRAAGLINSLQSVAPEACDRYFKGTGHWLRPATPSDCAAMISAKKGGIFTLSFDGIECADFGWIMLANGQEWVSHWEGSSWLIEKEKNSIRIIGHLTSHRENISSPFKHIALRCLSFFLGRFIIGIWKEKMIFKEKQPIGPSFFRKIEFKVGQVEVFDRIGLRPALELVRAPRSSKRHVASADSYHREDLSMTHSGIEIYEKREIKDGCVEITTAYRRRG
jgi:hypothetical protein